MNALAKIDGVMPWVSASAQADLAEVRAEMAELIAAVKESREALQAFANDGMPDKLVRHVDAEVRLGLALAKFGVSA